MGISRDQSGNSKISIKSLFLVKNEIIRENRRKQEEIEDKIKYIRIEPFANTRI